MSEYEGSVVLLHFWATWCAPCMDEMASLIAFYRGPYQRLRYRGDGLILLTVSNDVRTKDLKRFMSRKRLPFPVFFDPFTASSERFRVLGLPATVIIGPDGEVLDRYFGNQGWGSERFIERLETYIGRDPEGRTT